MYCNNCGKHNPKDSKFCQHCGIKFDEHYSAMEAHKPAEHSSTTAYVSQETAPYPYVISLWKLFILSTVTFGLFDIYWFYRQWKSFYAVKNQKHGWFYISFVSLFAGFSSFSLFKIIAKEVKEIDPRRGLEATGLSIAFLVLNALYRLPDPYWVLSGFSVFVLMPVQSTVNYYWEKKYGDKLVRSGFGVWNFIWVVIGCIAIALILYGAFSASTATTTPTTQTNSTINTSTDTLTSPTPDATAIENTYGNNFMNSCNSKGNLGNYCSCLLTYLRNNYTLAQRIQMDIDYNRTKQEPQAITDAVNACVPTNSNNTQQ